MERVFQKTDKSVVPMDSCWQPEGVIPKISVIVPVYKVEKYLPECIDSILAQSFTDFELVLVDDGSPDNSGKICDEYALRDSRIRVFHKENGGVSSARRVGVENAHGEWVIFVDGDDMLRQDALRFLFCFACKHSADVVECSIRERGEVRSFRIFDVDDYLRNIVENRIHMAIWGKLIRREVLSSEVLDVSRDIFVYEDFVVSLSLWRNNLVYYKVPEGLYFYRIRRDSVSRTSFVGLEYFKKLETLIASSLSRASLRSRMLLRYKWIRAMSYNGVPFNSDDGWISDTLSFVVASKPRWKDSLFLFLVKSPFLSVVFRFYKKVFRS